MAKETFKCSNCGGPVTADSSTKSILCGYCKQHIPNPLYKEPAVIVAPGVQPSPSAASQKKARGVLLVAVLILIVLTILSSVIISVVTSSPGSGDLKTGGPGTAANAIPQPAKPPMSKQESLEKKMDGYIFCIERAFPRGRESIKRYLSWVDREKGPTCKERHVGWGLYEMYDDAPGRCEELYKQSDEVNLKLPDVEKEMATFLTALKTTIPLVKEAALYYDKQLYLVDDCAKGQLLHPRLMAQYQALEQSHDRLAGLIAKNLEGALQQCLDRTAEIPAQVAGHQWANLIDKASSMIEELRDEITKAKTDDGILKKNIAIINEAAAAISALSDAQKEAAGYHWSHEDSVEDYIETCTKLLKSKKKKPVFEELVLNFNKMLMDYNNNMKFCGALPLCDEDRCPPR